MITLVIPLTNLYEGIVQSGLWSSHFFFTHSDLHALSSIKNVLCVGSVKCVFFLIFPLNLFLYKESFNIMPISFRSPLISQSYLHTVLVFFELKLYYTRHFSNLESCILMICSKNQVSSYAWHRVFFSNFIYFFFIMAL